MTKGVGRSLVAEREGCCVKPEVENTELKRREGRVWSRVRIEGTGMERDRMEGRSAMG